MIHVTASGRRFAVKLFNFLSPYPTLGGKNIPQILDGLMPSFDSSIQRELVTAERQAAGSDRAGVVRQERRSRPWSRRVRLLLTVLLALTLCTALAAPGAADEPEIRVGVSQDFRPYAFPDKDGRPVGYSIDLIQAVARAMGLRVQIKAGTWDQVWQGLGQGQIDVLAIVAKTPDRESQVDFSVPHTETFDAFFVRTGQPAIPNLAAAAGKDIVVRRSDAAVKFLPASFSGKLTFVETNTQGLALVAAGQHDAFLTSKLIGTLEMRENHIQGLTAGPPIPDYKRVFAFAVRKGNTELLEKLNQGLRIVKANGEYDRIYQRWLEVQPENRWQKMVPYLRWAVAAIVLLVVLAGGLQWLVRLRTRQLVRANETILAEVAERRKAEVALQQANLTLEQRVAERTDELRQAREWLSVTLSSIGDAVIATDTTGRVTFVNPVAATLTGWKAEEAIGEAIQNVFQIINEQTRVPAEDIVTRVLKEGRVFELANHTGLITKDGREIPIEDSAAPIKDRSGKVVGVVLVFHDVTEKRRAQEILQESEERLRLFIEYAPTALAMFDRDMRYIAVSRRWLSNYGLGERDLRGQSHYGIFPEIGEAWKEAHRRGLAGEILRAEGDRFERADGSLQWVRWEIRPWRNAAGKVGGIVIFTEDITERKQAQEALRANEERLRMQMERMPIGCILFDGHGRFSQMNPAAERIFGYTAEELRSQHANVIVPEAMRPHVGDIVRRLAQGDMTAHSVNENVTKDGRAIICEWTNTPLRDGAGNFIGFLSMVQDITERKQTEQALIRSEKLASVGRMAASMAHEINNPLEAITNSLFLVSTNLDKPDFAKQYLDIAANELRRVSHITQQTLGFYREQSAPTQVSAGSVMDSAVDMLRGKINVKGAKIEKQYDGALQLRAVSGELRQVFSNLLANSLDAIDQEGTIKLRISRSICVHSGQTQIRVTVADNGKGIDVATMPHIFEPLFTTKEATGSGLGLWVCKQIIDKHSGIIRVRSSAKAEHRGTTFCVTIPASAEQARTAAAT